MNWRCSFSLLLLPIVGSAGEIPDLVLGPGVGVNIHFVTGRQEDLDMIAAAGFRFVRMDFAWDAIEKQKGQYDWSGYEQLLANLDRRGLRAIFILDYSNPLYEETVTSRNPLDGAQRRSTASPQHPESIAAFARWAAQSAAHFRGRHVIWEIWNEPNIDFWSPKPNAEQYADLAFATAKSIRESEPKATIIAPATSGLPWEFLETAFKSGLLSYLDGVSVHPYREYRNPPETASADYQKLRQLIDRYAPSARKNQIPIISGEWGYATHTKGLSLEIQGAFAARQQLSNLLNAIPLSIWYDWKNDGPDPNEREHNFGTVTSDLKPKPAYVAIQTLTHELSGYQIEKRIPGASDQDYLLLCKSKRSQPDKLAAWTLGEPHSVSLEARVARQAQLNAANGKGEPIPVGIHSSHLVIELTSSPQYVTLDNAALIIH